MRAPGLVGGLVGVLSAAVTVGVGEAAAVFVRPAAAPVIAVGNRVITLTPESAKRSAISLFGVDDKTVLLVSIYALLVVLGASIGQLALRRLRYGLTGIGLFAVAGVYCALTANAARASDVIPTLVGAAAGAATMIVLVRVVQREDETAAAPPRLAERRTFLQGGLAAAGLAALTGFGGRSLQHTRFDVAAERKRIALPQAAAPALPAGVDLGKSPVPWRTPSSSFYRIDTALTVPQVRPVDWQLRIHGRVDRPITLRYADLLQRPMLERWITLCCVSNLVGGDLVGNALWLGTPLVALLREAGVHPDADQLLMTSVDGFTFGAPTKVVMDGRDALLAVGMNGAPLPLEHGFPVRVVVPGLYGYVSACKWVVDINVTTFAADAAYWVQGGWVAQPTIKLASRIDTPRSGANVAVGRPTAIAGVAWDQHVGVSAVAVQIDGGPNADGRWRPARLAAVPSTDTWRQWVVPWTPPAAGSYRLRVRATDASGVPQQDHRSNPFPSGATGLHTVTVRAVHSD